jgi:hypothetical protein
MTFQLIAKYVAVRQREQGGKAREKYDIKHYVIDQHNGAKTTTLKLGLENRECDWLPWERIIILNLFSLFLLL